MTNTMGSKIRLIAILLCAFTLLGQSTNYVNAQDYNNNQNYNNQNYNNQNYNNQDYNNQNYNNGNNYQEFYNDLAPYGQWYQDPQYGYVWAPNVGSNFRPYYSNGYWQMTDYGNMWVSNYSWGWATFHYGRWTLTNYGWIWIPGNEWAPAWVSWRQGGGYYGWAPLGPGVSFAMSFGSSYYQPDPYWTFIPYNYIYSRSFRRYYSPRRTGGIRNNTTIINNTYVNGSSRNTYATGPRRSDIESRTGRTVNVYQVGARSSAGASTVRNGSVNVYRPTIQGNSRTTAAPRNVKQLNESVAPRNTNSKVRESSSSSSIQRNTAPAQRIAAPVQRNTTQEQRSNNVNQNQTPVIQQPSRNYQNQTTPRSTPAQNRNETAPVRRIAPVETSQQQPTRQATPQRETRQVAPQRTEQPRSVGNRSENSSSRSEEKQERFR